MTPKRFFFFLVACISLLIVGGGAGYYLGMGRLRVATADIREKLAESHQNEDTIASLSAAKALYKHDIIPILPTLTSVLPQTKNQTEILIQLQTLAKSAGLSISSASFPAAATLPSQTSQTTKFGEALALPITFSVTGRYDQLQTFLTSIENLNRLTTVNNLTITHPDASNLNLLSYALTVNTYVKP